MSKRPLYGALTRDWGLWQKANGLYDMYHHLHQQNVINKIAPFGNRLDVSATLLLPPFKDFDASEFLEGATYAYRKINALLYKGPVTDSDDSSFLRNTCTPYMAKALHEAASHAYATTTLQSTELEGASLLTASIEVFSSGRERELEHRLRGYDAVLVDCPDEAEREALAGVASAELESLRDGLGVESGRHAYLGRGWEDTDDYWAEMDVIFQSLDHVNVQLGDSQAIPVQKKITSSWRFVSKLDDDPAWRLCLIT
ncbi:hypothetical protein M885DRAFT_516167 [Pelagophyceae sp. CCMP2097]|nr:hypothetical protein M885DRAFT_516167 [Pelagophyceae sp. CCMP2097]|mmetsp:Transcript_13194/g.45715  ORF Transcript_13194/g.45715 Transcript_13194/m.45715 type:complete len:256 (+) Transcript_13194:53-820(+)